MDKYTVVNQEVELIAHVTDTNIPNKPPHDITFVSVAWNEARRAPALVNLARKWFSHTVIGVQESTDGTLDIVRRKARETDEIVEHPHYGYGDKSMPSLVSRVKTRWAFVVAFDEIPSPDLLGSLQTAAYWAEREKFDAVWVPFRSIVEGVEYTEQHGHLRLFEARLGWPKTLHSRPQGKREMWWPYGHIVHERTLDEMIRDYLRYYHIGRGNMGWDRHNLQMIRDACTSVAATHGWAHVEQHEWWPEVKALAF